MPSLTRSLALVALLLVPQMIPATAADRGVAYSGMSSNTGGRVVTLGIGKSYVVDLPSNAAEVLVADPKIANAVVRSARKAYLIGIALGETDIIFFDAQGNQIESLAVSVARDMSPIRNNLLTSIPEGMVSASAVGDSVVLTGSVKSPAEAATASAIAANLVGAPEKVVNALAIENRDQVMLKVSVVEMKRDTTKQLGINWEFSGVSGGTSVGGILDPTDFASVAGAFGIRHEWGGNFVEATLEALEEKALLRTLAEPTLSAISGERAEFLAGGEFPVPVGRDDNQISIEFKKFGVGLTFTPVVLSSGRISLQIGTEVSELSSEGAIEVNNLSIPALSVRRANTTVELPSGGSYAIAGLLQDKSRQAIRGTPGLINLPVLGSLFRSRDYQRGQTELVVIVTPYIAKPNGRDKLALPDDGFSNPSDTDTFFLGQLNNIYAPGLMRKGGYQGPIGYTVE
ncbi:type II and III secretion system protein family protein [Terrihabitans soli]|nr:type II and III secretion system protein family protein [Terrihabitans soli]